MNESSLPGASAAPLLRLRCESWREFVDGYAGHIGSGGLFVPTELAPPLLSLLEVRLQLPDETEICLRTRVVQVLGAEQAKAHGQSPGLGLELMDMEAERKYQLFQLIEFARQQAGSDDPNASFTRALLETSPSLQPSEVGYRLSMLPGQAGQPPRRSESRPLTAAVAVSRRPASSATVTASQPAAKPRVERDTRTSKRIETSPSLPAADGDERRSSARSHSSLLAARDESSRPAAQSQSALASARSESSRPSGKSQSNPPAPASTPAPPPTAPSRPTDPVQLKLVLTNFAHKHYDAALRVTREMLQANPGDPQVLRWQSMCNARLALARNDDTGAVEHYEQALQYGEDNREAREFVRNHQREKKLNSLPFGRYFTKKK